jgi:hypothetical protein
MPDDVPEAVLEEFGDDSKRRAIAAENRAAFERMSRGALARADLLDRAHLPQLGFAVADLMLMQLVTGRLKPKTAKEAMDVAKLAAELARKESGEADSTIVIRSPEERENALLRLKELAAMVAERQGFPSAPKQPEAIEAQSEVVNPDIEAAALVTRATTVGRAMRRVPAMTSEASED